MTPIILASKSPRRKQLLEAAGIPFTIQTADTAEDYPSDMDTEEIAVHIAVNKARAVAALIKDNSPILAADTIVAIDGQVLGKPRDLIQAVEYLRLLSGKTHQVITGVCIWHQGIPTTFSVQTEVRFHPLRDDQISYYVEKYQPLDKAGAYGVQEWIGLTGIHSIQGDYYNVVGLPVSRVIRALENLDPITS
ncbi:MAG TPA: Maf family nucleotide pyrophosphatase [Arachidicoccus sp.]|nr:Maf family nucleotide pyrophosphatase [Arachidicoccus sp.]